MPKTVNLYEAKTHLSELVERAARGEEVVIAKAGEPKARLVPLERPRRRRRPVGLARGLVVPSSFFDPLPDDVLDAFEGR